MALITRTIPSMLQGISQQPPELRHPTQGDVQENGISHPTHGLGKRAGTDHIRSISGMNVPYVWSTWICRDNHEKYVAIYDGDQFRIFGLGGREYTITYGSESMKQYLHSAAPKKDLASMTLTDTTLILNRSVTAKMTTATTSAPTHKAMVWVKQGSYGADYFVKIGTETLWHHATTTQVELLRTNYIASVLKQSFDAGALPGMGYQIEYEANDSIFYISRVDGADFDISVSDSLNGFGIGLAKEYVKSFSDLPPVAPDGLVLKVLGSPGDSDDDYFVVFNADRTGTPIDGIKRGLWVETVAPSTAYAIDPATMPHRLDRMQDDSTGTITGVPYSIYFKFDEADWEDRHVGGTDTAPNPSFIDHEIQAMAVYQDRLALAFKSNVIFSRTSDLFNFWPSSVTRVRDDDPIDVSGVGGKLPEGTALNIQHMTAFADRLMLIGNKCQVTVDADQALTPTSIRTKAVLALEADDECAPVVSELSAFIPYSSSAYVSVREVYPTGTTGSGYSFDQVTRAVPTYIPGRPIKIAVCPSESTLLIHADGAYSRLYIYRWLRSNNSQVQSSWGHWLFLDNIISFEVIGSVLWLLVRRPDLGMCLESMEMEPFNMTERAVFPILLDRKSPVGATDMRVAGCPIRFTNYPGIPYAPNATTTQGGGLSLSASDPSDALVGTTAGGDGTGYTNETGSGTGIGEEGGTGDPGEGPIDPTTGTGGGAGDPGGDPTDPGSPGGGGGGGGGGGSGDPGGDPNDPTNPNTGGGGVEPPPNDPTDPTGPDPDVCIPSNDRRQRGGITYNELTDRTSIICVYRPTGSMRLIRSDTMQIIPWEYGPAVNEIVVRGDLTGAPLYTGFYYWFFFRFGPALISKQDATGGLGAQRDGHLQVIRWGTNFSYAGPWKFLLYKEGDYQRFERIVPNRYGTEPSREPVSGRGTTAVMGSSQDMRVALYNDSPWPSWFTSADWEGLYYPRAQSI